LSELEAETGKDEFFRVNRKYLVNAAAVSKFRSLEKGKILLELDPAVERRSNC
jgi:DNA-binding LytR/AlgR family response regulator